MTQTKPVKLTEEEVQHVADLAQLHLSSAEIEEFAQQLSKILAYAEKVQSIDTQAIAPTPYILPLKNVLADDVPQPCLANEAATANAPDAENGYFRVTAVFDE